MLTDIRNELLNLELKVHEMKKTLKGIHKTLIRNGYSLDAAAGERMDIEITRVFYDMGGDFLDA